MLSSPVFYIHVFADRNNNLLLWKIVRANEEQFKEAKKMCEALKELMKEELDESRQQGISQGISQGRQEQLLELIRKKIIKGKSIEQIAEELEETKETILPFYNRIKEEKN